MPSKMTLLLCLMAALAVGACSSKDKPPLKGDRISVLQLQDTMKVDEDAAQTPLDLPIAKINTAWPQAGGNATHTPYHLALGGALKNMWSVAINGGSKDDRKLITPPIIANDLVYVANTEGDVAAYQLNDGKKIWQRRIWAKDEDSATVSPGLTFGEGKIFATDGLGKVLALDPMNGTILWQQTLDHASRGSPTVQSGRLYVITLGDETIALDAATGNVLWTHKGIQESAGLLGAPSPAAEGSVVITLYSSGDIVALRAETGQEAWSDNLTGVLESNNRAVTQLAGFRGHPVLDGDNVIVGNNVSRTIAIHVPSGERLWQKEFGSAQTPWVAGNAVYVLTTQNELVSLLKETGQARWLTPLPRFEDPDDKKDPIFWNGPVLAGGRLITVGSNGKMLEVSPENGKILKETALSGAVMLPPVVAQNKLVILTDGGKLSVYQ